MLRNIEKIDYRKAYTIQAVMTKTNSFIPYNSLQLSTSWAIQDYVLSPESPVQHTSIPITGFVHIDWKKAKVTTLDSLLLKDVMFSPEAEKWKTAM